jgi:peptidoglycan/xylan/chitin deacetylase (PgdA/CDA1 family)
MKVSRNKSVFLTFDDGPHAEATPKILRILEDANIKATFFLSGKNIAKNSQLVKTITEQGHDIGNHSYYHRHAIKTGPFATYGDLIKGHRISQEYSSQKYNLFRPPYGKMNLASFFYLLSSGSKIVYWNLDPKDYSNLSAKNVADYILENIGPGKVILLHDGRQNLNDQLQVTVDALDEVIQKTKNMNLKFNTISALYERE